jgi:hypothetical protein
MGYWNNGMLKYWVWRNEIYFYIDDMAQKLNQNIIRFSYPIFHFSTIPLFHWIFESIHHPSGVKSKPGPLGQDSLFRGGIHELEDTCGG